MKKAASKLCNWRLRYYQEDADGAVKIGESGKLFGSINTKQIADELKMTVSSVTLCYQRTNKFKTYFNYANIQKAFDNKDQELFALEKQIYDNRALQINKKVYVPTVTKRTRDKELVNYLDMIPHPKRRWHYTDIIEALKKDNRNKLWDKPMPNFTFRDYEVLKKL